MEIVNAYAKKMVFASFLVLAFSLFMSVSLSAVHHVLLILPAIWLAFLSIKNKKYFISYSHLFLLCVIIFSIISVLFNVDIIASPVKNIFKVKYLMLGFLGTYAVIETFQTNKVENNKIKLLVNLLLISTTIATIAGLIGAFWGYNPLKMKEITSFRASGMFGMIMSYAYALSILLTGIFAALVNRKTINVYVTPWILWSAALINLLGLYFSYTRGATIAFMAALPFIIYHKNKKLFGILFGMALILLIVVGSIVATKSTVRFYRFSGISSELKRMSVYKTVSKMIIEKPVYGVGYRNVEPMCPVYKTKYNVEGTFCGHAHNNYLEMLAGTGVMGFVAFMIFLFFWLYEMMKRKDIIAMITVGMIVNFMISGMTQSTIIDSEVTFLLMALYMLSQIIPINRGMKYESPIS